MCCCRDKEELKITFTLLGVEEEDMMVYDDLTAAEIREKLGGCSQSVLPAIISFFVEISSSKTNHKNYAWLTVVVLSHGRRVAGVDEVLGVDGEGIDRREVGRAGRDQDKKSHLGNIFRLLGSSPIPGPVRTSSSSRKCSFFR